MAEISADPRLGAERIAKLSERAQDSFIKHTHLLIRQAMQDGRLPGQSEMPEAEELAALELREPQLLQTFQTDQDALLRAEAGVALTRLKELRDG